MKQGVRVISAVMAAASAAFGWGSLVASYTGPAYFNLGLGYLPNGNNSCIFLSTQLPNYTWRLNPLTGSITASFTVPSLNIGPCDAGVIGRAGYCWVYGGGDGWRVFRQGYNNGSIYSSWNTNGDLCGLAFRKDATGQYLIMLYSFSGDSRLARCDVDTGSVYATYHVDYSAMDIACDGEHYCYWIADWWNQRIRRINYIGQTIDYFDVPYGPRALAYEPGRNYVWVGDFASNEIHVYETEGSPLSRAIPPSRAGDPDGFSVSGIVPASLGRVKATYR